MWPDKWTAVTEDGKRSAQFEHTLLVTDTGCDIITRRLAKKGQPHFMDKEKKWRLPDFIFVIFMY